VAEITSPPANVTTTTTTTTAMPLPPPPPLLLHLFNGLFSRTTCLSQHQTGKTSLDLNVVENDEVLITTDTYRYPQRLTHHQQQSGKEQSLSF